MVVVSFVSGVGLVNRLLVIRMALSVLVVGLVASMGVNVIRVLLRFCPWGGDGPGSGMTWPVAVSALFGTFPGRVLSRVAG